MIGRRRSGIFWRVRYWIGSLCVRASWILLDPDDGWAIEYHLEGELYGAHLFGPYSIARAKARELGGRVIGHRVQRIEA